MMKLKSFYLKVIYFVVIVITFIQVSIFIFSKEKSNKEEIQCITEVKNVKYIKDIENELSSMNNSRILSYNKKENEWNIRCILKGNKEEIISNLKKIDNYYILNYNLNYKENSIELEMELISK
ncbi:hypothetical protein ACH36K_12395 [Clostridium sp. MB05]|jgi:hypothetical protein|uniref:hypothetical protein n=1 Tax=Clostridium sp. MB05 TaxID=3376682 RepID=UPI003981C2F6